MRAPARTRANLLVAGAVLAAAVLALAVLAVVSRGGGGPARVLLPDLVQRAPYSLVGQTAPGAGRELRFRIGFASAVENYGDGPLRVVGRRPQGGRGTMVADQVIERSDGSTIRLPGVGTLRYTRSTTHEHWHYLGFDRYQIVGIGSATPPRRDRKTGFCLGDRYDARPTEQLPGDPGRPVRTGECGRGRTGLRSLTEGISVGYGDDYDPILEGQYLDITGLPAGRYELVHWVNSDRRLREADYGNNAASILFDLGWPRGLAGPPQIDVVARCGDGRRCRSRP